MEAAEWRSYLEFLLAGSGAGLEGGAELEVSDRNGEVVFLAPLGVLPWLVVNVPYWNWYGFPTNFTLCELADKCIGFSLTALTVAVIVKQPVTPAQTTT